MLNCNHLFDLPLDIKLYISQYDQVTWTFFAIYDDKFRLDTYKVNKYRKQFVNLFTKYTKRINSNSFQYVEDEEYKLFNKYHRENNLPACIYKNGQYTVSKWYIGGKLHRDERDPITKLILPACIVKNGRYFEHEYWQHGYRFRERSLPTVEKNSVMEYRYSKFGLHRKHGPALIIDEGVGINHNYFYRGVLHNFNSNDPTRIWYKDGKIIKRQWYKYGKLICTLKHL